MILDKINYFLFGYFLSVDFYSFAEIAQVRRGVQSCSVSRRLQDGGKDVRDLTFAICAGYMQGFAARVRAPEIFVERKAVVQVCLVRRFPRAVKHRQRSV